jgi:hypothetical protein
MILISYVELKLRPDTVPYFGPTKTRTVSYLLAGRVVQKVDPLDVPHAETDG